MTVVKVNTDLVSDVNVGPSGQQQVDQLFVLVLDGPRDGSPSPVILYTHTHTQAVKL